MSHVGWESFGEENHTKFKEAVETLYNSIDGPRNQKDFMFTVAEQTKNYIQDRHFMLSNGKESANGGHKKEAPSVGKNFAFEKNKPDNFELIGRH